MLFLKADFPTCEKSEADPSLRYTFSVCARCFLSRKWRREGEKSSIRVWLALRLFFCACSKDSFFPPSPRINGETSRTYACVQKRKDVPLLPFYFCFAESHICLPRNQCYASRSNQHLSVRIIHVVFLTLILMLSSLFFFLSPFPPFFFNLNHFLHNYVHPVVAIRKRKLSPCFFFFVREVTLSRDAHIHVYARHHQSSFLPLPLHFQT